MGRRLSKSGEKSMKNSELKGPRGERHHSLGTREEIYGEEKTRAEKASR